jgi:MFS superfamily sulfate permease-like transporter
LVAIAISTIITFQVSFLFLFGNQRSNVSIQVGLFTFLLGFVRLGFIDVILSRALLRGFVTAVAVVITMLVFTPRPRSIVHFIWAFSEQIIPMIGLAALERTVNPTTTPDKVAFILDNLGSVNKPTAILSVTTLFILIAARTIKRKFTANHHWVYFIPEIFLTVVISTLLSSAYRWDKHGIAILGDVALSKDDSYFEFPLTEANLGWLKSTTPTAMQDFTPSLRDLLTPISAYFLSLVSWTLWFPQSRIAVALATLSA